MSQLDPLYTRFGEPDTLAALSNRYHVTAMLFKLPSGKFAVYGADRELFTICERWELTAELIEKVPAPRLVERAPVMTRKEIIDLDLEL